MAKERVTFCNWCRKRATTRVAVARNEEACIRVLKEKHWGPWRK